MKTFRKLLALLLALVMCVSMLPLSALAEEPEEEAPVEDVQEPVNTPEESEEPEEPEEPDEPEELEESKDIADAEESADSTVVASGTCGAQGNNLTWTLDSDGVLTISGSGEMKNYDYAGHVPWSGKRGDILKAVLSDDVESIGRFAFFKCENLSSVNIPEGVTVIGDNAFASCTALPDVTLPSTLTEIGDGAFNACESLTLLVIPAAVTIIGSKDVFTGCVALEAIQVDPASSTFWGDSYGVLYSKDQTLLVAAPGALSGAYVIPAGVESINKAAFNNCAGLTSVTVPSSVTALDEATFRLCSSLSFIDLSDTLESIALSAFWECTSLTCISLPRSLKSVDMYAFFQCPLTDVFYQGTKNEWDALTINKEGNHTLLDATLHCEASLVASGTCGKNGDNLRWTLGSDGVLTVSGAGEMADYIHNAPWYAYRSDIRSVVIKDGVTSIGEYAFAACASLTGITFPESVTVIGDSAFRGCTSLTSAVIPERVTVICDYAFANCSSLPYITIPTGVTGIGYYAFSGCASLTKVEIPAGVKSIGIAAFLGCDSLTSILVDASNTSFYDQDGVLISRETATLLHYPAGRGGAYAIPEGVTVVGEAAFFGCTGLRYLTLPESVTSIAAAAVANCTGLEYAVIPKHMTGIANGAFAGCASLRDVYFRGTMDEWLTLPGKEEFDSASLHLISGQMALSSKQAYCLLRENECVLLSFFEMDVRWAASADGVIPGGTDAITVSDTGLVTAARKGTAYATAYFNGADGEIAVTASCRIDVTENAVSTEVTGLRLLDTKATVELYQTEHAKLRIVPVLSQNGADAQADAELDTTGAAGAAVESAEFVDAATAGVFDLRIVDDRTLEIAPKAEFVTTDAAKLKTLKTGYKSALKLTVDGKEFTTPVVSFSVKKTLPKLTVKVDKLNSFFAGDTKPLTITGAEIESLRENGKPAWLGFDKDARTVTYNGALDLSQSGKLNLLVKPVGCAVEVPVTVTVSATKTAPKLKLAAGTLNIQPGKDDTPMTAVTLTPAAFDDVDTWPIEVVSVTEGKTEASDALSIDVTGRTVSVKEGEKAPTDGKAHTYTVLLGIKRSGTVVATAKLTVKLLAASSKVTVTAKASGTIDTAIPESPITVALTAKNITSVWYTDVSVLGTKGKNAPEDMSELFRVTPTGPMSFTLTEKTPGSLSKDYAYSVKVTTNVGAEATAKLSVKFSDPKKVTPSVTIKTAGSIDVIRPASSVTVTPTVKNCFTYKPAVKELRVWKVDGKLYTDVTEIDNPFDVELEGDVFVLTLKKDSGVNHEKDKFAVSLSTTLDGYRCETAKANITVKMGTAKFTQSAKDVNLLGDDRYSRAVVTITPAEAGLSEIDWVKTLGAFVPPMDRNKNPLLDVMHLGGSELAIFYTGSTLKTMKSATVKIPVFLKGNETTNKPNATISVTVKVV